jgi:DnaK suppressor protein
MSVVAQRSPFGFRFAQPGTMKAPIPIHNQLNKRRAALEAKLRELTGVFQNRSELTIENSADILDTIHMATDRDVLAQRMNISARILSDVRRAVDSLENGDDAICEDCDEPISLRRLDAIPWARVCVKCQEARDSRSTANDGDDFVQAA